MEAIPTHRKRLRPAVVPMAVVVAALFAAGCGSVGYSEGTGDRANGKELFVAKCASCHTLADAGTKGLIGPNLDDAFRESRLSGLGESTIVQVVRGQIEYPIVETSTGAPGMPGNLVEGQGADDVASYVGSVAGLDTAAAPTTPAPATPPPAASGTGDATAGKAVFASAGCDSCHTLADAGAEGTVGPNLDDTKPDAARVSDRVTNGLGVMPPFKGQLDATQIADVAAYVSTAAGQ